MSLYCTKGNWNNWLTLRHTFNRMLLTSSLEVQYIHIRLHNDDNELVQCAILLIYPLCHNALDYLHTSWDCTVIKEQNPAFQDMYGTDSIWLYSHLKHTTTENLKKIGKIDTSDLMIVRWVTNTSYSPKWWNDLFNIYNSTYCKENTVSHREN